MKIQSKLVMMGSLAALATSPLAFADKETPVAVVEPAITEEAETAVSSDETTTDNEVTDTEPDTGEVTDDTDTVTDVEISEPIGEVKDVDKDDGSVPIEWVKRGDGENPEIFYNMAGGEAPVFKGETARELGQDDKAAAIEAKGSVTAPIKGEKKEPVALIKKGRVFLR